MITQDTSPPPSVGRSPSPAHNKDSSSSDHPNSQERSELEVNLHPEVEQFFAAQKRLKIQKKFVAFFLVITAAAAGSFLGCLILPLRIYAPFLFAAVAGFIAATALGADQWLCQLWQKNHQSTSSDSLDPSSASSAPLSSTLHQSPSHDPGKFSIKALSQHMECLHSHTPAAFWRWSRSDGSPYNNPQKGHGQGSEVNEDDLQQIEKLWLQQRSKLLSGLKSQRNSLVLIIAGLWVMMIALTSAFSQTLLLSSRHALSWLPGWHNPNTLTITEGRADLHLRGQFELQPSSKPVQVRVLPGHSIQLIIRSEPRAEQLAVILTEKSLANRLPEASNVATTLTSPGDNNTASISIDETVEKVSSKNSPAAGRSGDQASPPAPPLLATEEKMVQSFRTQIIRSAHQASPNSATDATVPKLRNSPSMPAHEVTFRAPSHVSVWIPRLSRAYPVAEISIVQPRLPQVGLVVENSRDLSEMWPDEEPLNIKVAASSEDPLTELRWIIQSRRGPTELPITKILAEHQTRIVHPTSLLLAPFMVANREHFHIMAEAVAVTSEGQELVGRSDPLELTVISAYGRYRKTLELMSRIRSQLWEWEQTEQISDQDLTTLSEAMMQTYTHSQRIPFFNRRDRLFLSRLDQAIQQPQSLHSPTKRQNLLAKLHDFLEEHEALDDHERDRDFFVAARALGQALQSQASSWSPRDRRKHSSRDDLTLSAERIEEFLKERHERWAQRLAKIPPSRRPNNTPEIMENLELLKQWGQMRSLLNFSSESTASPFSSSSNPNHQRENLYEAGAQLSAITQTYRKWIDDLEKASTTHREDQARQHQSSLGRAEQKLRGLQGVQDHIVKRLDQSGSQISATTGGDVAPNSSIPTPSSNPENSWEETQKMQAIGLKEARELIGELSKVPYISTQRLGSASEAMARVLSSGSRGEYEAAEDAADRAARLLREGNAQIQRQRQNHHSSRSSRRSSARKNMMGNDYYGSSVVYIPLEQEHNVAEKYRQNVLIDAGTPRQDHRERNVMKRYLREMLR